MKKRSISLFLILYSLVIVISIILSVFLSNILFLIYTNPEGILSLTVNAMLNNLITVNEVQKMFWIILCIFGIILIASRFNRLFGIRDYKSKTYKVTDDIEIPVPVGNKQTQQGSSWWLSEKKYKDVFDINTLDPENKVIKDLLYNADEETKAIKKINVNFDKETDKVDEIDLLNQINDKFSKLNLKKLDESETKPFKKGGIVLGRKKRKVFSKTSSFPYIKVREVEDIYFVGDNVHTLTVGSTRSGKTRCEVIESIYNCGLSGESMVISDPKGELFEYTSGALKQLGYNVVTLDFKNPMKSSCYNFLQPVIDEVRKGNIAQAQQKASDICESIAPDDQKTEKIWSNGEKATIKAAIMSVATEAPEDCKNIANVYYFLVNMCRTQKDSGMFMDEFLTQIKNGEGLFEYEFEKDENGEIIFDKFDNPVFKIEKIKEIDEYGNEVEREVRVKREPNPNHPAIGAFAPALLAADKTRQSFFASALTSLVLFSDEYIAKMTSKTEIKAEDLANKKTALYMILPDEKLTYYSLCSLFVNQIYQQLVNIADQGGGTLKNRVNFILDEFGNFAPIPNFGGFLTVGGGRRIRFNLFLQSFSQLNSKYDENTAQNILDNCHIWTYLKTSNDTTAEKISKKLRNIYLLFLFRI